MSSKKAKRWTISVLLITLIFLLGNVSFNAFIDPLWMFKHAHPLNDVQNGFNLRLQKINQVTYQPFHYDSMLLGNSRVSYIDAHDFTGERVYNFAVEGMKLNEIREFIKYAQQRNGIPLKKIYIGLDLYHVNAMDSAPGIQDYLQATKDPLHRLKQLLSWETTKVAYQDFDASYRNKLVFGRSYNRNQVRLVNDIHQTYQPKFFNSGKDFYKSELSDEAFQYSNDFKAILRQWQSDNPQTTFVIFTPPICSLVLHAFYEQGRMDDYKRWLKETVDVFGEVHHFQFENSISQDLNNFIDLTHFRPRIGTLIVHQLTGVEDPQIPDDFSILLTRDNIDSYLASLENF